QVDGDVVGLPGQHVLAGLEHLAGVAGGLGGLDAALVGQVAQRAHPAAEQAAAPLLVHLPQGGAGGDVAGVELEAGRQRLAGGGGWSWGAGGYGPAAALAWSAVMPPGGSSAGVGVGAASRRVRFVPSGAAGCSPEEEGGRVHSGGSDGSPAAAATSASATSAR